MKLSELKNGDKGIIVKVKGRGAFRKRITEMGFIRGKEITVVKNAPLKDPIEYQIMGYQISLRRSEASLIEIISISAAKNRIENISDGVIDEDRIKKTVREKAKTINIALVGNPNSGKTTLFNHASGSKERVGNYSGVTVDLKRASFSQDGYVFNIVDLPGTYSMTAYSPEELFVRNYILNEMPDIVINVIDASNLERNLYLTTQLIDMDTKVVVALNMYDELLSKGDRFDYETLGKMIGIPFIPTIGYKGKGMKELFTKVIQVYEDLDKTVRHIHINYGTAIENSINRLRALIKESDNKHITNQISPRFLSIKLLEKDKQAHKIAHNCSNAEEIFSATNNEISTLELSQQEDSETLLTDAKYAFVSGAIKENYKEGVVSRRRRTETIDTFMTHKLFGFPIFIFFLWLMFQTTFSAGQYPVDWIESGVEWIGSIIGTVMSDGILKDLIINGIIDGVGGVIVFLPNILILFFFISLMEDTGYMARVAFIMDKVMHKVGLHGKSFIPMIMGFGCNVPAIMATRTLESKNDRLLTMLINPFMSCSARLPIYILFAGAFFSEMAGTVMFSIYIIGILLAVVMALLFKKLLFKSEDVPFVMELPPYRFPTIKSTIKNMWNKGSQYLKKMGGIILVASIIIWALGYFPRETKQTASFDKKIETLEIAHKSQIYQYKNPTDSIKLKDINIQHDSIISNLLIERESDRHAYSYIGRLGKAIAPVLRPLGFDWKMSVSILTGIAAKEIVISTMSVLYQAESESDKEKIEEKLRNEKYTEGLQKGEKVFSPLIAFVFMLFILIYFPCVASLAAIKNESGSWKWAAFSMGYTTILAWLVGFIVYQVGSLFV